MSRAHLPLYQPCALILHVLYQARLHADTGQLDVAALLWLPTKLDKCPYHVVNLISRLTLCIMAGYGDAPAAEVLVALRLLCRHCAAVSCAHIWFGFLKAM